jgi:hypothetical protein
VISVVVVVDFVGVRFDFAMFCFIVAFDAGIISYFSSHWLIFVVLFYLLLIFMEYLPLF